MNRKEAKELMPIIHAFAEGKTIQYYDSIIDIADWEDCENMDFAYAYQKLTFDDGLPFGVKVEE